MSRQRKIFSECRHRGFGVICRRCNPWPKRDPKTQLQHLDKMGLTAKKERQKLAKRIAEEEREKSKNTGDKPKQERQHKNDIKNRRSKGHHPRTKRRSIQQNKKFPNSSSSK